MLLTLFCACSLICILLNVYFSLPKSKTTIWKELFSFNLEQTVLAPWKLSVFLKNQGCEQRKQHFWRHRGQVLVPCHLCVFERITKQLCTPIFSFINIFVLNSIPRKKSVSAVITVTSYHITSITPFPPSTLA